MAAFNKKVHLRQNIDAIKVAFTLEKENRPPTYHERTILKAYSGFGAIKEVLDPPPASDNKANVKLAYPTDRRTEYRLKGKYRKRKGI